MSNIQLIKANWPAPDCVQTSITTRQHGVSKGVFSSLNLGMHVGDDVNDVLTNRQYVQELIPLPLAYLNQIHSNHVVSAQEALVSLCDADASFDHSGKVACCVMTADCLPVLLCNDSGSIVAAAHAGWRGLANGVLNHTISAMQCPPNRILAYLGPAISQQAFEVGHDVYQIFTHMLPNAQSAFIPQPKQKYLANIYTLATLILNQLGVTHIYGGDYCTFTDTERFFSYRRDGVTGRMLSAIWLQK